MENTNIKAGDIIKAAQRNGSLKDTVIEHADKYGIEAINTLFPEAKLTSNTPGFINNDVEWVNKVLGGVSTQPFTRIKTLMADISVDTVKAKGYTKTHKKVEDVFSLLKRTTEPTTIYDKQKLDRDDVIDITDFSVVAWIKTIMRMKLDEALARAILFGDGRDVADEHKIDESCIRPIYNDDDLYTIKITVPSTENVHRNFIETCIRSRKRYRGSGTPTLFTTEDLISEILLLTDTIGNRQYKTVQEIKDVLRVSEIVTVEEMNELVRPTTDNKIHKVLGVIVNLTDYAVGADKGGKIGLFDDFDIDYNQQKFLIETRCSGSLTKPYSAMVLEEVVDKTVVTSLEDGEAEGFVEDGEAEGSEE